MNEALERVRGKLSHYKALNQQLNNSPAALTFEQVLSILHELEGNYILPKVALVQIPDSWSEEQLAEFKSIWSNMVKTPGNYIKMILEQDTIDQQTNSK